MLDVGRIAVEELADALADQTDYEHRWLIDPRTGEVRFWTSDTGIDGQDPVEIDDLDLVPIDPSLLTSGTRTWSTSQMASATTCQPAPEGGPAGPWPVQTLQE